MNFSGNELRFLGDQLQKIPNFEGIYVDFHENQKIFSGKFTFFTFTLDLHVAFFNFQGKI